MSKAAVEREELTIVHVGPQEYGTSLARVLALQDLGHRVHRVYSRRMDERPGLPLRGYRWLRRRAGWPAEGCAENRVLTERVNQVAPDVVFIEKALTIRPATVQQIAQIRRRSVIAVYCLEYMLNPDYDSRYFWAALPYYDVVFTCNSYNIDYLLSRGARRVEFTPFAYSIHMHRPVHVSPQDHARYGADVSFVGGYEPQRAASLNFLADCGIPVRIWGNNWHRFRNPHPALKLEMRPAYGEDYAKVACSSKILLGYLRKINRDTYTTRSFEIPAFGAFMLAERTARHEDLFQEGVEAEYFDSNQELVEKTKYYLIHDEQRETIARKGLERCHKGGYSYNHRMRELLSTCAEILNWKRRPER